MAKQLSWTTVQRKVNDLVPLSTNPRQALSGTDAERLMKSLKKFNLASIPVINKDETIIGGHKRIQILQAVGRGEELIDVRIPSRLLNEAEVKELNLIDNVHVGKWDLVIIEEEYSDILEDFIFEVPELLPVEDDMLTIGKGFVPDDDKLKVEVKCDSLRERDDLFKKLEKDGWKPKVKK